MVGVIPWNKVRKDMKNSFQIHLKMVEMALEFGVSKAARMFGCSRVTIYKWLRRYQQNGLEGLQEASRAPHHHPRKISPELEERILAIRREKPFLGPRRIKSEYGLPCSESTIYRVLKRHGMTRPRKRKHRVKRQLRELKKQLRVFEKLQVDVKELSDIPRYYPYVVRGFPRYQFTARDVRSGFCFISYAHEKSATHAALFIGLLLSHLKDCGVALSECHVQTDNGSEFVTVFNAKNPLASLKRRSAFQQVLDSFAVEHRRIPPRASTYNSDVEAFHRIVEDEFYDWEHYRSRGELLQKANTYMQYFNQLRVNSYKDNQTPVEIIHNSGVAINTDKLMRFRPLILDNFLNLVLKSPPDTTVNHLMKLDKLRKKWANWRPKRVVQNTK